MSTLAALSERQQARAQALRVAREVLRVQTGPFTAKPPDPKAMQAIAEYILTGEDYPDEQPGGEGTP